MYDCPNDMLMQQKKFVRRPPLFRHSRYSPLTLQIKHGLTTEALQSYAPLMWSEAEQYFTEELGLGPQSGTKSKTVELFREMSQLIILTASRTLQGKEVRQALNSRFAKLFHDLDGGFIPINFMFTNLPLPANVRRDRAQKEMSEFYRSIIEKRRSGEAVTVSRRVKARSRSSSRRRRTSTTCSRRSWAACTSRASRSLTRTFRT